MSEDVTVTTATPKQQLLLALSLGKAQGQTAETLARFVIGGEAA